MKALTPLAGLIYIVLTIIYFNSYNELHKIIEAEKPDWLRYKGEPSIFYSGMPRGADPNVGARVIGIAFSRKARELQAPSAYHHAKTIRTVIPAALLLFAGMLYVMFTHGAA